ncbi:MAG: AMP-binding protein [Actinomycetota bacterium]|nr:AMP-binding protein [Actinomycetota bacterium]
MGALSTAGDGLKQIGQFLHPRTIVQLHKANALAPKNSIAMLLSLPWLIGRGPSLGIITQMHGFSLARKAALHDRDGSLTWAELDKRANQAGHMLEELGVKGGDRVAMLLRNGHEIVETTLGAQKFGMVACPLNTWAKPKELKFTLSEANASVLIYDTKHSDQVEECAPEGLALVFVGNEDDAVADSYSYVELLSDQSVNPPPFLTREVQKPKVVIHTSGTTGTPKGASRNSSAAGVGALANLLSVVPYSRDDIIVLPAPLFHSFGLATFTFGTALGATFVLAEQFDPEGTLRAIEEHRATACSLVPVMIKRILNLDGEIKSRYDLSSLRVVMASGSAMSTEMRKAAMELFGDVLYDLYGSTEVGWVAIARPQDMLDHPGTVGEPVPGIEVAIFNEDGDRLRPGQVGEIYIKSDVMFEGYTSGDSKEVRDGYMTIGDLGYLDDDGFLFIEGRADDMVVVGGENIYPVEIEETLDDMDGVEDVAVMGVPDDEYGEVLGAFVVGKVKPDDVKKYCKDQLASYKVPKRVEILDELPRTSTGKVLKRELIEQVEES